MSEREMSGRGTNACNLTIFGCLWASLPPGQPNTDHEDLYFQWLQQEEGGQLANVGGLYVTAICHRKDMTP